MSAPSHEADSQDATPELRELRLALRREYRSQVELREFLVDYFPEVARRTGPGADRTELENLLLQGLDSDDIRRLRDLLRMDPELERLHGGRGRSEDWRLDRIERAAQRQLLRWQEAGGGEKPQLRRRHAQGLGTFFSAEYQQGGQRVHFALLLAPHEVGDSFLRAAHAALIERGLAGEGAGLVRPSEVVFTGAPPSSQLVSQARDLGLRLRSLDDFECLLDLRDHVAWQSERLAKHPAYPPSLYVRQRMQISEGASFDFQSDTDDAMSVVMSWLKDINRPRFVLLLGDFGVGKTFLLREVARRLGLLGKPPWPLFLELRQLEKAQDLRPLLSSYLARPEHSETIPVSDVDALLAMLAVGKVVLFFDGFDELALRVGYERSTQHLDTLMQSVATPGTLAKVVVSSRSQHFLSMADLEQGVRRARRTVLADRLSAVAVSVGRLLPFAEPQIVEFLRHRLGDDALAQARMRLITDVKDLLGLSHNPRMLSFIADLPEADLRAALAQSGTISAATLYEVLVHKWLQFEVVRADERVPEPGLSLDQRLAAVTTIALHLWGQSERFVALDTLGEAVRGFLRDHDCAQHQLGSGTLLTRDDAGRFAFLHESVLEWLVARAAKPELAAGRDTLLGRHALSPLMAEFLRGLAGDSVSAAWAERILLAFDEDLGTDAGVLKNNALTLLARMGRAAPERQNLAGQDLRGRDFTGQSLAGAILDGARLDDAQLSGADLRRSSLRGASLLRANLDRARLCDADLRGADLSTASLLQADLRGARVDARTWLRRARLLAAKLDPGALDVLPPDALWGAARSLERLALQIAGGGADALAWHPTEPICAAAIGPEVVLWDCIRAIPLRLLRGHDGRVTSVSFSPDGLTLASGASDHTVRLWNPQGGQALHVLRGHENSVTSVSFSPDGLTLASGASDNTVRLWNPQGGQALHVLRGHENSVTSVSFSPDGLTLASGAYDKTVRLWNPQGGQALHVLRGHESIVTSVSFSPDGLTLASGAWDNTVRLWNPQGGHALHVLRGHESSVNSVSFSPDGLTLASGADDNTVRLWNPQGGQALHVLRGHESIVTSVSFSPDGLTLASGAWDKTVRLWNPQGGQALHVLRGHENSVTSVSFSPDGLTLASGASDNTVRLWNPQGGHALHVLRGHESIVTSVSFSPDGLTLASGAYDHTVRLWNPQGGQALHVLRGHESFVTSVSFSPDGLTLASGASDHTVRLWNPQGGQALHVLRGHENSVTSVSFSPDGLTLASGASDNTVRLWNPQGGQALHVLRGHENSVTSVSFSPDGLTLASGASDNTVRLWNPQGGHALHVLRGHESIVTSVSFSPDGLTLASGAWDKTVRLWNPQGGHALHVLRGHESFVNSVSFSPDGCRLVSSASDGSIRIWEVATGRCLASLFPCGQGWLAQVGDGRYKRGGELPKPSPVFVSAGLCHFEPGELEVLLPGLRLDPEQSLFELPDWDLSQHPEAQALLDALPSASPTTAPPTSSAASAEPAAQPEMSPAEPVVEASATALASSAQAGTLAPPSSARSLLARSAPFAAPILGAGLAVGAFWLVEQRLSVPTAILVGLLGGALASTMLRTKR